MLDENDIFILKKLNLNIQYRPNSVELGVYKRNKSLHNDGN